MYKQVLIPDKANHTIEMPEEFFGKKVEVIVVEIGDAAQDTHHTPPAGKKVAVKELFESFGSAPDFPSVMRSEQKHGPLNGNFSFTETAIGKNISKPTYT